MKEKKPYGRWQLAASILFWMAVWQLASMAIAETLLLPSPLSSARALVALVTTGIFWQSIATSLWRIGLGFFLGLAVGCLLAALAAAFTLVEALLRPLMMMVQATPVASFIILALLWVSSRALSTFTSFLMVLPVIYGSTLAGIEAADPKLLEMARVFRLGFWRRVKAIYLPALAPGLLAACQLALGLCWKSGVAAEVIGLPKGTIGERLYQAKIFLMTPELFAWTAVIILLSWAFGRLVLALMTYGAKRVGGGGSLG